MMDETIKSRVYAVVDDIGRIVQIEGEYSLSNIPDLSAAILVEEGEPCDRLNHAQNMYLEKGLLTVDGIPLYKWDGKRVVPRSEEEIEAERAAIPAPPPTAQEQLRADVKTLNAAVGITFVVMAEAGQIDAVTAAEHAELFTQWAYPVDYKAGNIRRYTDGKLYKCLQDHTSQEDWAPPVAVSLWVAVADPAEEWPEWSQSLGAHDAYNAGDKVSHNGQHWTSDVDANVWEPGVYGWTENE